MHHLQKSQLLYDTSHLIHMQPIITILGPTAIGKSSLAVKLADQFKGAIISADSRQIYKNFDIGSGKIKVEEMQGIQHYILDIRELWQDYNVAEFQKDVKYIIENLEKQNTLPFLVGGTGLYIESILYNYNLPNIAVNSSLRAELSKLNKLELQNKLLKLNSNHNLNHSDWNNPVRLIRAIEIVQAKPVAGTDSLVNLYRPLIIGLQSSLENIKVRITKRVDERLEQGAIEEVENIKKILVNKLNPELTFQKLTQFGLGTVAINQYLEGKIDYEKMRQQYIQSEYQYARRQLTWFRRMKDINWFEADDENLIDKTSFLIADFLR
ncbi:tRNA (adenosine(37)-N6)-dimethylallyltransferase MiaA [bacterium]|nr:tRNA (adenosine(37)-N6)-dimethylallyltransferase MiaA [Candidatus Elulimicrobium humile]